MEEENQVLDSQQGVRGSKIGVQAKEYGSWDQCVHISLSITFMLFVFVRMCAITNRRYHTSNKLSFVPQYLAFVLYFLLTIQQFILDNNLYLLMLASLVWYLMVYVLILRWELIVLLLKYQSKVSLQDLPIYREAYWKKEKRLIYTYYGIGTTIFLFTCSAVFFAVRFNLLQSDKKLGESRTALYYGLVISILAVVTAIITLISSIRIIHYSKRCYYYAYMEDRVSTTFIAIVLIVCTFTNAVIRSKGFHEVFKGHEGLEEWLDFIQSTFPALLCSLFVPCDDFIQVYNRYPNTYKRVSVIQYKLPQRVFDANSGRITIL